MFIPNRFASSSALQRREYDEEGRLRAYRISGGRDSDAGIAGANSRYPTESEYFDAITPFLKRNRLLDSRRRNYVIQPGGASIIFDRDKMDPYLASMPLTHQMPSEQETFGHNSMDGTKLSGSGGGVFNVSDSGPAGRTSAK